MSTTNREIFAEVLEDALNMMFTAERTGQVQDSKWSKAAESLRATNVVPFQQRGRQKTTFQPGKPTRMQS